MAPASIISLTVVTRSGARSAPVAAPRSASNVTVSYDVFFTYLFKNDLASHVTVFKLLPCLFLPRTSKTWYNQLAELVATFIYICI